MSTLCSILDQLFIHLFDKNSLNIYIVPGITADNRDRERNKIKIPASWKLYSRSMGDNKVANKQYAVCQIVTSAMEKNGSWKKS